MNRSLTKALCALLVGVWGFAAGLAARAEDGTNVVVVFNRRLPESQRVADHYAAQRGVPAPQVIGLDLPTAEIMTREEYRLQLAEPLWRELLGRRLFTLKEPSANGPTNAPPVAAATVRYAVLCYGVPLKIAPAVIPDDPGADQVPPPLNRNEAAVDSELSLLPMSPRKLRVMGPINNPFYGQTNAALFHPTNGLLMVARLDGPSEAIARGLVDKALEAEREGLWGRAYGDARGIQSGDYRLGDDWMTRAAETCRQLGWETTLDNEPALYGPGYPLSQIALYFGWYEAHLTGAFVWGRSEFRPGAFAYHLHSGSADTLRSTTHHWVGPLLARGITATMGTVYEPYLGPSPDPATFLVRFLHHQFSFGEAAYAAQSNLSWQTTVVGDPLYRPFARHPQAWHAEMVVRGSPLAEWSHLKVVNLRLLKGEAVPSIIDHLAALPLTARSAVLQEKLGDLCRQEGRGAEAVQAWFKALDLGPTDKQRLRLWLHLAAELTRLNRPAEALDQYLQLERAHPDYPDLRVVHERLLPLARQLQRTDVVSRVEKLLPKP